MTIALGGAAVGMLLGGRHRHRQSPTPEGSVYLPDAPPALPCADALEEFLDCVERYEDNMNQCQVQFATLKACIANATREEP